MHVLLINLPAARDRLAFQQAQLSHLGLSYTVLPAVPACELDDPGHRRLTMGWERPLRLAELSCYLSHHAAWTRVAGQPHPMLVLEDDALLARQTPQLLAALRQRNDCDLVTLEVRSRKKIVGKPRPLDGDRTLLPLYQDRTGAAAYVLWPAGARVLLEKAQSTAPGLADEFIASTYALRAFQVEPAAAIQLDQCQAYGVHDAPATASTISSQRRPLSTDLSRLEALPFHWRRFAAQLRMGVRFLSVLHKGRRRDVALRPADFDRSTPL